MMRTWILALGCFVAPPGAVAIAGEAVATEAEAIPEKAVCRVCELRGAGHGSEKVAASRSHEGKSYHFCSKPCAEAFDGFPEGYAVHPLPRTAPEAVVTTMEGGKFTLGAPGDGVMLLDFWATWCAPCKKAMPELEKIQTEYGEQGLSVVGVSIDEKPDEVRKFLKKKDLNYTIALDSEDEPAWHAYFVAAIPAMVLVDRQGNIVGEWRGAIDMEDVRDRIDTVLAEATAADPGDNMAVDES